MLQGEAALKPQLLNARAACMRQLQVQVPLLQVRL